MSKIVYRSTVEISDIATVKEITLSTGYFYDFEVDVAEELIQARHEYGPDSDYQFIFAELNGETVAYACYGPIACTKFSYDLYWIVTHQDHRGKGIGHDLLTQTCKKIVEAGGSLLYAETSGREQYSNTRYFYDRNNFECEATIKDFYDWNDDKLIYVRNLTQNKTS